MRSMGDEKISWRRELYFFLYSIPSCLNCPSIFEIGKKKAKVLNCTDLTDEVAPGRPDPITFSR